MYTTHVFVCSDRTGYGNFSVNVGACAFSVYQALLSPHKREPGFEAICGRPVYAGDDNQFMGVVELPEGAIIP